MSVTMSGKEQMMVEVESALEHVRPHLAVDGGNVALVDITDDQVVLIKWLGACRNCDMTLMTLKAGIEDVIKRKIPSVREVKAIEEIEQ